MLGPALVSCVVTECPDHDPRLGERLRDSPEARVHTVPPSNLYGCTLEDDVFVGPFCEVQTGVRIGARSRVQSHSFLCSGVTIGEDCFIGHGVMFCNDTLVDAAHRGCVHRDPAGQLPTTVGATSWLVRDSRVLIGNGATILPGVTLCAGTVIGAGAVVTKSTTQPGTYAGNPARLLHMAGDQPLTFADLVRAA